MNSDLNELYSIAISLVKDTQPVTVLLITADSTFIATGSGEDNPTLLTMDLSSQKIGAAYFHHTPPTHAEVEHAINATEDELMRITPTMPANSIFFTQDRTITQIAAIAGRTSSESVVTLTRDSVEALFSRFAAISLGRPMTTDPIPLNANFAATLLILREVMHHLGFESIKLLPQLYLS